MSTDSPSKEPKYVRLKEQLLELIRDTVSLQGDCLPSERLLGERFGVSRVTIRRAVAEIEQEGLLYRIQGKGAFICKEKIPQYLAKLTSFSDDMRTRDLRPDSRILALESITAGSYVAEMLKIDPGDPVVLLKRLRLADGEPMAIETCYIRNEIGAVIMDTIADGVSLYKLFADTCGIKLKYALQSIEISTLKSWEKKLLGNESPPYALFIKRQTFDIENVPVEYVESKYRSDRYRFHVELGML